MPGTRWLNATRYNWDLDHNGLAMEAESGQLNYLGTEIIVFPIDDPTTTFVVAGSPDGEMAANPSWTSDGRLIFIALDAGQSPLAVRFERLAFESIPAVASVERLPNPSQFLAVVDPRQFGPSDGGGFITFSGLFNAPNGWMSPLWRMPATGTTSLTEVSFVGCPICPAQLGCCGSPTVDGVKGTNDSRISHAGTEVTWTQQHPDLYFLFGGQRVHPYRQSSRGFDGGLQVDLAAGGAPSNVVQVYAEWSPDDRHLAYWTIEISPPLVRHALWVMNADGTNRHQLPLPTQLCPQNASYFGDTEIVFTAWQCSATECSCAADRL